MKPSTATRNGKSRHSPAPPKVKRATDEADEIPPVPTPEQLDKWAADSRARIAAWDAARCGLELWLRDSEQAIEELLEGAELLHARVTDRGSAYYQLSIAGAVKKLIDALAEARSELWHCEPVATVIHRPPVRALLAIPGDMPKGGDE